MGYCRVLIIDDELITRQGIKHMMLWEKEGFQIVGEASNGQEGLELVEKLMPDIVLADIVMPVINGIDFSFILHEKFPAVQLIMLSSYDDFEYVKTTLLNGAVDYVLKPTLNPEILLKALEKAVRNIPGMKLDKQNGLSENQQLERYLTGFQKTLDMDSIKARFPYMQYVIMAIDLKTACENNRRLVERVRNWIINIWEDEVPYKYMATCIEDDILCMIFNFLKKDEKRLKQDIQSTADKVMQVAEKTFFVLSEPFTELELLRDHFMKEVCPCLKQRFYFPGRNLVSVRELSAPAKIERFEYDRFSELLSSKMYDKSLQLLQDYTKYLCENHYDEYLAKNLIKNLLYNFLMDVEEDGVDSDRLKGEYFRKIDKTDNVNEFLEELGQIYEELNEMVISVAVEDERIREIKAYIWEHSGEKLDLAEIADVFGFNYHYISSYFNQYISEGFSGYLNKIRIEKACTLLRDRKIPIADVSGEVGYSNHGYFCRVFKKMTGKTPSQYRHSMKEWKV